MANTINNSDDVIDSRDVIERIDELEGERNDLSSALSEAQESDSPAQLVGELQRSLEEWDDANGDELKALKALQDEAEGYAPDWKHGCGLVRYSHWVAYVQEMLEDIGDLPKDLPHYIEIDWDRTAENIKVDYTTVEFDGVEYFVR